MKIRYLFFIILFCIISNSVWAQSSASSMQFEGYGYGDWRISYKGKPYSGLNKKPEAIAKECNCDEAALLFKDSRKLYRTGIFSTLITTPIGIVVVMYSSLIYDYPLLAVGGTLGGAAVASSPILVTAKSNLKGRSAVFEFNKCIESKSAK